MDDSTLKSDTPPVAAGSASEDGLEPRFQNRNALVFAALWALTFLAAPVLYIGFV